VGRPAPAKQDGSKHQNSHKRIHFTFIQMSLMAIRSMIQGSVTNEIADITLGGRPGTHQTVNIRLDKFVKTPPARLEASCELVVHPRKDRICLHWEYNFNVRLALQILRKLVCCAIGALGVSQPHVGCQESQPRRSQKTHLRAKLAGLFHSIVELARNLLVKKYH
jgi:hypothetical protein